MAYSIIFIPETGYFPAVVSGMNSKETVEKYITNIRSECTARNCFKTLIEERLEGPRIDIMDVFAITDKGSRETVGFYEALAYVDVYTTGTLMRFAETVGRNRGISISVFSSVADAEAWLFNATGGKQAAAIGG